MSDTKFQMTDMTPAEAAKFVRNIATVTASGSQNWDNFQAIVESMILSAMEAGRAYGRAEAQDMTPPPHTEPDPERIP